MPRADGARNEVEQTMQRRKFLATVGSLTAASAAAMGTGAFEGAYINAERDLTIDVKSDANAYLGLVPTSKFAHSKQVSGGWEGGQGVSELEIVIDRLNVNGDTRLDDVFRVRNQTGQEIKLKIGDEPDWNGGYEDAFQVWAQPTDGGNDQGSAVRLDDGGYHTMQSGEEVEINIFILLKQYDPNGHQSMQSLSFIADGTDA